MMTASGNSPNNPVRGPARRPEWSELVRLGGDRVAVLFQCLRKAAGTVDGIVERLQYSEGESRWFVQYYASGRELFAAWISPGQLEVKTTLTRSEAEALLGTPGLSRAMIEAMDGWLSKESSNSFRLLLADARMARSFAKLMKAKSRLASSAIC